MTRDILYLAAAYLRAHKGKTLILSVCLGAALALPLTVRVAVGILQAEMTRRAADTPLVIGAAGSRFDLVLHALNFRTAAPAGVTRAAADAVTVGGHAEAIPLHVRFTARGYPVVGTSLEYFALRGLVPASGHVMTRLGDVVVGWGVARALDLQPGDWLRSDPDNVFDLAGAYPLEMRVTGILARSRTPDDHAVFVDLNTAWMLEGIGHGHAELDTLDDPTAVLAREGSRVTASPALELYTRITPETLDTFHFHGDPATFPLTAVIAVPLDDRAATLLLGRYLDRETGLQALRPAMVVDELLGMVVRLKRFFDAQHAVVLAITALLMALVMALSLRLRRREFETLHRLGCSRGTVAALQAAELCVLLLLGSLLALLAGAAAAPAARLWIRTLT